MGKNEKFVFKKQVKYKADGRGKQRKKKQFDGFISGKQWFLQTFISLEILCLQPPGDEWCGTNTTLFINKVCLGFLLEWWSTKRVLYYLHGQLQVYNYI